MKLTQEWKIVIVLSLLVVLFSQLPLIFGYATQGDDEVFMGIPVRTTDANNHLHWVLQAKEGNLLFTNKFTHEDVPALIFNPFHLIVGWITLLTGLSAVTTYNIIGILAIFGFLLYLYHFISYFVPKKEYRLIAFLFIAIGSGLGALWRLSKLLFDKWISSADLWVTDMTVFASFSHPHFTLSMLLLLAVLLHGLKAIDENNKRHALIAGSLGLLLATIHIFDIVTLAVVLAGYFFYTSYRDQQFSWSKFGKLSIVGGMIAPAVIYYAWVFLLNPAYAEWNALNQTITPPLPELLSGLGILFFIALFAVHSSLKHHTKKTTFLSVWLLLNLLLVYIPINVQRRFLLGIFIPVGILATLALQEQILPHIQKNLRHATIIGLVIFVSLTPIVLTIQYINNLHHEEVGDYNIPKYLTTQEYETLLWIDQNLHNDIVILAPLRLSNHIPAVTGNKVYLGHWAQTIQYEEKKGKVNDFYESESGDIPADIYVSYRNFDSPITAYQNDFIALKYLG